MLEKYWYAKRCPVQVLESSVVTAYGKHILRPRSWYSLTHR